MRPSTPDLLCATPSVRVDLRALRKALVFAFAAGGAPEAFDDAIAAAKLPETTWDKADFARDVYLDELVARCLPVRIGGKTMTSCTTVHRRVSCRSRRAIRPTSRRVEPCSPSWRRPASVARSWRRCTWRSSGCGRCCARRGRSRRVDGGWRCSARRARRSSSSRPPSKGRLRRSRACGRSAPGSSPGRRTRAWLQLLDHDEHQGSLDLRVRVGADGEVRAMQIVGVREDSSNPFHVGPAQALPRAARTLLPRLAHDARRGRRAPAQRGVRRASRTRSRCSSRSSATSSRTSPASICAIALPPRGSRCRCRSSAEAGEGMTLEGLFNPLLLAAGVHPVACDVRGSAGGGRRRHGPELGRKDASPPGHRDRADVRRGRSLRAGARADASRARRGFSRRSTRRRAPTRPRDTWAWSSFASAACSISSTSGRSWCSTSCAPAPTRRRARRSPGSCCLSCRSSACRLSSRRISSSSRRAWRRSGPSRDRLHPGRAR